MRDLAPHEFDAVLPLVPEHSSAGHMTFVHAVLEGSAPGFVLADAADSPTAAIVGNLSGFWVALGRPTETFLGAVLPELAARCPADGDTALWTPTREWERAFGRHLVAKNWRSEFQFSPESAAAPLALPPGLSVSPIDERIAGLFGAGLDPWVIELWGGPARFVRRSFGYAVLRDGKPVSFCAACAIQERGAREVEIEIGTDPREREAGLARAAGLAFIEECGRRNRLPAWTCGADNIPSARLAAHLGFVFARNIAGFRLHSAMKQAGDLWI